VWFFNLEAANSIAVRLARAFFHLPYHRARMFAERETARNRGNTSPTTIVYAGVRQWPGPLPAAYAVRATASGPTRLAAPGTLEHFLIERYVLYAHSVETGQLYQGRVHHTPYPIQSAHIHSLDETLLNTWNLQRPDTPPLVHFSDGVDVKVFPLCRIASSLSCAAETT
jgi:uncharacterized protein YqjF (DUF2071 family)